MPLYEYPNVTSVESFLGMGNTYTAGWFWTGIMFATFIIVFMAQKHRGWKTTVCFATTSFFNGIIAMFFNLLNLISDQTLLISIVLTIVSFIVLYYQGEN